jgi:hypothetical protein
MWTHHRILETVEKIAADLKRADNRVLKQAYQRLEAAAHASNDTSRRDELRAARSAFAEICAIEPEKDNSLLIALGHYGSFCCFTAIDDSANAFRCVYECTKQYPDVALQMFPPDFFSKNYGVEIPKAREKFAVLEHRRAREEDRLYGDTSAKTWRAIGTAMRTGLPIETQVPDEAAIQAQIALLKLEDEVAKAKGEFEELQRELTAECTSWLEYLKRDSIGTLKLDHFRKLLGPP